MVTVGVAFLVCLSAGIALAFLYGLIPGLGSVSAALIAIATVAVSRPELVRVFIAAIAGAIDRGSKLAVRYDLEGALSAGLRSVSPFGESAFSLNPSVEWVKPEDQASLVKSGKVVIRMKDYRSRDENLVRAAIAYMPHANLRGIRDWYDFRTTKAADLTMAGKVIGSVSEEAHRLFKSKFLSAERSSDDGVSKRLTDMTDIDARGLFEHVFIHESLQLAQRIQFAGHSRVVPSETIRQMEEFVDYLANLVRRKRGDDSFPLEFRNGLFDVAFLLTAAQSTMELKGESPYVGMVEKHLRNGRVVYVLAVGQVIDDNSESLSPNPEVPANGAVLADNVTFAERVVESVCRRCNVEAKQAVFKLSGGYPSSKPRRCYCARLE